jgi:hypothetical protein
MSRKRFGWSTPMWWACQDLNLGPHPYQQNAGNRCAKRRCCRSCSTVEVEVMCSHPAPWSLQFDEAIQYSRTSIMWLPAIYLLPCIRLPRATSRSALPQRADLIPPHPPLSHCLCAEPLKHNGGQQLPSHGWRPLGCNWSPLMPSGRNVEEDGSVDRTLARPRSVLRRGRLGFSVLCEIPQWKGLRRTDSQVWKNDVSPDFR